MKNKKFYINDIQVSKRTYKQYLEKEFKRLKVNCKDFDETVYKVNYDLMILNDIEFKVVEVWRKKLE